MLLFLLLQCRGFKAFPPRDVGLMLQATVTISRGWLLAVADWGGSSNFLIPWKLTGT